MTKRTFDYQGQPFEIDLQPSGKGFSLLQDGKMVTVEMISIETGRVNFLIDGLPNCSVVAQAGSKRWVTINGQTLVLLEKQAFQKNHQHSMETENRLMAQMPGLVRAVMVSVGETVKKGQTLAVLEAMKMEHRVLCPFDGKVEKIMIKVGQIVESGQLLLDIVQPD